MHATQFGMCKCGFPRRNHSLRKVRVGGKKGRKNRRRPKSVRAKTTKKEEIESKDAKKKACWIVEDPSLDTSNGDDEEESGKLLNISVSSSTSSLFDDEEEDTETRDEFGTLSTTTPSIFGHTPPYADKINITTLDDDKEPDVRVCRSAEEAEATDRHIPIASPERKTRDVVNDGDAVNVKVSAKSATTCAAKEEQRGKNSREGTGDLVVNVEISGRTIDTAAVSLEEENEETVGGEKEGNTEKKASVPESADKPAQRDSLNMLELQKIAAESDDLFKNILAIDIEEGANTSAAGVLLDRPESDSGRVVSWSMLNSRRSRSRSGGNRSQGSPAELRVGTLETENRKLRTRLVSVESERRKLEVEIAMVRASRGSGGGDAVRNSSKGTSSRSRQRRVDRHGSLSRSPTRQEASARRETTREVLEGVCRKLISAGFGKHRVRRALQALVVEEDVIEGSAFELSGESFMGNALRSVSSAKGGVMSPRREYLSGGGLGSASDDDEEDGENEASDAKSASVKREASASLGLHLNWVSSENSSLFDSSGDRRDRFGL
eukprot:g5520.t1